MSPPAVRPPTLRACAVALLAAGLLSGCFGIPAGAADTGDLVLIRYTVTDLSNGTTLRSDQTASFEVGSGGSGLGLELERAVRGHAPGDSFEVEVRDDPSLGFTEDVRIERDLAPIAAVQEVPKGDFARFTGRPAEVNVTFPAYGIYTGRIISVNETHAVFRVEAEPGQRDEVPEVGAVLETQVGPTSVTRRLDPVEGAIFPMPPRPGEDTLLGLQPGLYLVTGATDTHLLLKRSASDQGLMGKDLRFDVTVVDLQEAEEAVPTDGNFGVRGRSPQLEGDPYAAVGAAPDEAEPSDGHDH